MKKRAKSISLYSLFFIFIFITTALSFGAGSPTPTKPATMSGVITNWAKFGEDVTRGMTFSSDLDKARYVASRVGEQMAAQEVRPNYSHYTRITLGENGTCGDVADRLEKALTGAGFEQHQVSQIEAHKAIHLPEIAMPLGIPPFQTDVNSSHGALALVIDGKPYTFELWVHGGANGSFNNFQDSPWNGIPTSDWGKALYQKYWSEYNQFRTLDMCDDCWEGLNSVIQRAIDKSRLVTFIVRNRNDGQPIGGAKVSLTSATIPGKKGTYSETTSIKGRIDGKVFFQELSAKDVFNDMYNIVVTAKGYQEYKTQLYIDRFKKNAYTTDMEKLLASVIIEGPDKARIGEKILLKAVVKDTELAPQKLTFNWSEDSTKTKFPAKGDTLTITGDYVHTYKIKVEVSEKSQGKEEGVGEATHTLTVTEGNKVSIKAPLQAKTGDTVNFAAVTNAPDTIKPTFKYAWSFKGDNKVFETKESFTKRIDHPGQYDIVVVVYQDTGKQSSVKFGEAKHTLTVTKGYEVSKPPVGGPSGPLNCANFDAGVTYTLDVNRAFPERYSGDLYAFGSPPCLPPGYVNATPKDRTYIQYGGDLYRAQKGNMVIRQGSYYITIYPRNRDRDSSQRTFSSSTEKPSGSITEQSTDSDGRVHRRWVCHNRWPGYNKDDPGNLSRLFYTEAPNTSIRRDDWGFASILCVDAADVRVCGSISYSGTQAEYNSFPFKYADLKQCVFDTVSMIFGLPISPGRPQTPQQQVTSFPTSPQGPAAGTPGGESPVPQLPPGVPSIPQAPAQVEDKLKGTIDIFKGIFGR